MIEVFKGETPRQKRHRLHRERVARNRKPKATFIPCEHDGCDRPQYADTALCKLHKDLSQYMAGSYGY